ncbi:pirin family protein [Owenweeksia hongkongensis]|uniref:pirin family protein n=1 Tax=Owenweeksia hongkongensis TaxID=253245 RepID=UPI003A8E7889
MSNTDLIIEERSRDIGDFLVGRILPFRKKRMVGPFIYFDHMGPKEFGPNERMDIGPHPHIGLSTLTYLLEGKIVHRDSLGTEQTITPGAVNWMTAGKGIVHSERSPKDPLENVNRMHGLQIWVALPLKNEEIEPSFHHIEASQLPIWKEENLDFKLIAGKAFGRKSPVPVYSDLFLMEVHANEESEINLVDKVRGEVAIYVLEGGVKACDQIIPKGNVLVSKKPNECGFTVEKGSHILIFGGEPFEEERHIYWNFVASSKDKIEAAKERWKNHKFSKISGDDGYVPLPEDR